MRFLIVADCVEHPPGWCVAMSLVDTDRGADHLAIPFLEWTNHGVWELEDGTPAPLLYPLEWRVWEAATSNGLLTQAIDYRTTPASVIQGTEPERALWSPG